MATQVDARGLSCPQPVLLMRNALQEGSAQPVVVLLDSSTQAQNCTRAAAQLGWQATCTERGGEFELTLRK